MNIVDKSPKNYYELDVTIDGVKRKYIPLGRYFYYQGIDENLPEDIHNIDLWLEIINRKFNVVNHLAALGSLVFYSNEKFIDKQESPLCNFLLSNCTFIKFYEKYFGEIIFNYEIFMDNSQVDVKDYTDLGEFDSLGDEDVCYEENGNVFEIVNSKSNHTLYEDAFQDFLIDQRYLEDFEKDYREIVSLFKNYTPNRDE